MNHKLAKPFLNEVTWYLVGSKFQTNKKLVIVYLLPRRCKQTNSFSSLNSIIAKLCVFFLQELLKQIEYIEKDITDSDFKISQLGKSLSFVRFLVCDYACMGLILCEVF